MSFEVDEEILQDFLVEAGEILEQLSEQLVDLEQNPDDKPLLNAIFRGFHTVKGGAGFLQLTALVDCCHYAENVFDILRNGQRKIDSDLMDIVLQALDAVNEMFDTVRAGGEPERAAPELISALSAYATAPTAEELANLDNDENDAVEEAEEAVEVEAEVDDESSADETVDISDDEFESLLDALGDTSSDEAVQTDSAPKTDSTPKSDDDITEDEFDALLNQLHGSGAPGITEDSTPKDASNVASSDEITEDEFEELLDKLHGESGSPSKEDKQPESTPPGGSGDLITEDEFESLLDSLQSQNKGADKKVEEPVVEAKPKAGASG